MIRIIILLLIPFLGYSQCPQVTSNSNNGTFGQYQLSFELDNSWENCNGNNIEVKYKYQNIGGCQQENWFASNNAICGNNKRQKLKYVGCDYSFCVDRNGNTVNSISIEIEQNYPYKKEICNYSLLPHTNGDCQYMLDNPMDIKFNKSFAFRDGCYITFEYEISVPNEVSLEYSYNGFDFETIMESDMESDRGKLIYYDCDEGFYRFRANDNISKIVFVDRQDSDRLINFDNKIVCNYCDISKVRIFDFYGREVYKGVFVSFLNYSFLSKGYYIAIFEGESHVEAIKIYRD